MRSTAGDEEEVPVLIVGGGGAGLTSSMLLARLGVEHLLVSARPQTSGDAAHRHPPPAGSD
jgi:heterodisulfide reductase subunit A-like polyferredoxin